MVEVTEVDKLAARDFFDRTEWHSDPEADLQQILATRREAAAKAERDRLRAQASLEKIARSIGRETVARDDRGILFDDLPEEDKATVLEMLAAALADALESQHD